MYLEGGLENLRKRTETKGKSFYNTEFHLRIDEAEKGQKQGREERMQEDYRTSAAYFCSCPVVFSRSSISALFLSFFSFIDP